MSGPSRSSSERSGSRWMTACGLPTETGMNSISSPATSSVSGSPTLTSPISISTSSPPSMCASTTRSPTRTRTCARAFRARQPARGDANAVTGQLRQRAVGVPDLRLDLVAAGRDDLDDAVRADAEVVVAELRHALGRELERRLSLLQRAGSRFQARATSTISSATSSGDRLALTLTSPGMRRIHFRW